MAVFVNDTMTGTAGTVLSAHTGETGASWTLHSSYGTGQAVLTDANRVRSNNLNQALYYASGTPASADYDVEVDMRIFSLIAATQDGPCGRINTSLNTMYYFRYRPDPTVWEIGKLVGGTSTILGSYTHVPTVGNTYHVKLEMRGTTLKGYIDGVLQITATDSAITAAGRAGIRWLEASASNTTGIHFDNFSATDPAVVPANTVAPVISGIRVVGQTLTSTTGTWTNTPTSYAYQWTRDGVAIAGATASTYIPVIGDVGTTLHSTVVATNADGSGTAATSSNGLVVTAAMANTDIQWLQGGTAGLGGPPGATITDPRSVFDDVLSSEAASGDIEYRLMYLRNAHTVQTLASTVVWISSQTTSPSTDLAIGVATEASNTNVGATADEQTAPAGVTFGAPSSNGSGFSMGSIPAGEFKGLWLRRTVTTGAASTGTDSSTIDWQGSPA